MSKTFGEGVEFDRFRLFCIARHRANVLAAHHHCEDSAYVHGRVVLCCHGRGFESIVIESLKAFWMVQQEANGMVVYHLCGRLRRRTL